MALIIQMTGLSGSGKTTLSKMLKTTLEEDSYRVALIDGDTYRATLCKDLGFSKADRIENIRRLGVVAAELSKEYDIIIIAAINPYEEGRSLLKQNNSQLVYIKCDLQTLIKRDPKGLYERALLPEGQPGRIDQFTGISDVFEIPQEPAVIIDTANTSPEECIAQLKVLVLTHSKVKDESFRTL
ncbi:adenylyl-sulfate kinase [Sphingobacterium spiritivorum]|uniref:adenylyl-sulfate kinase n=1 Tax=Sphingobacterium spiritivorum TaxID=258 RepID=UPI003DA41EC1